jgi:hypothetical protein
MSAWRELDLAHAENLTAPGSAQLHLAIRWPESQKFLSIKKALEIGGPERSRTSDLRFRKPLLYPEESSKERSSELISNSTSADASKNTCFKGHLETVLPVKVQSSRESGALENGFGS